MALTFLNRTPALLENLLEPFEKPAPGGPNGYYTTQKGAYLRSVEISGPYRGHRPGQTRRAASGSSSAGRKSAEAKQQAPAHGRFSRRWPGARSGGRSPTPTSRRVLRFYEEGRGGRATSSWASSARWKGCWSSPEFLYPGRARAGEAGLRFERAYRISDLELASRLSFFLWSSIPDDALLDAAASRASCETRHVLEQQVRRMLADPRADALVTNFVGQWLFLRNLPTVLPDPKTRARLRRRSAAGLPPRDGAVRRQHPARRSQRARAADGELHVRQRAAREALRHSERPRHALPARRAPRRSTAAACSARAACWR